MNYTTKLQKAVYLSFFYPLCKLLELFGLIEKFDEDGPIHFDPLNYSINHPELTEVTTDSLKLLTF